MILAPLLVIFLVAVLVTAAAVPLVRRVCRQQGWLAQVGPRHVHQIPTPTLGGSAIFAGLVISLLLSFLLTNGPGPIHRLAIEHERVWLLLGGATLVWLVATIDDIHPLSPLPRLLSHVAAALIAVGPYLWQQTVFPDPGGAHGIIITAFENPFGGQINLHRDFHPLLAIAATVFWIVGLINTLNWLDGLDGLAAGVTLIAAFILAIHTFVLHQYTLVMLPLILAGACLGFLPFNFHPARIFMGDGGAMLLGYTLAIIAIIGGAKLASALLVMGIPILDVAWLIITRTLSGQRASDADRQHLHHRLYDLGFGQRQVVAFYYSVSAIFGAIALLIPAELRLFKLVAIVALFVLLALVLLFATHDAERTTPVGRI